MSHSLSLLSTHIPLPTFVSSNSHATHVMNSISIMHPSLISSSTSCVQEHLLPTTPRVPPEILLHIFEDLHRSEPLSELRLVNQHFYIYATTIYYRHVTLTEKVVTAFSSKKAESPREIIQRRIVGHMIRYTKDISVESYQDYWAVRLDVPYFLLSLKQLRSIKSVPYHHSTI